MNERIKELRKELNLTQLEFAKEILLTQTAVYDYEKGRSIPNPRTVMLICQKWNVSEEWLRNGVGEMFKPIPKRNLVAEQIMLIFEGLDERNQKLLFEIAKTIKTI